MSALIEKKERKNRVEETPDKEQMGHVCGMKTRRQCCESL